MRIDGRDVRALTLASLGRAAGLVIQDKYLFHGTLRSNLHPRPDATCEELEAACADAQLPTMSSPPYRRGWTRSWGNVGTVSAAGRSNASPSRVILKNPPVLILDEATSHLDSVSEELVQKALARLFRDRTSLVIAHRLSTVLAADLIVVLDRGRIVERGKHSELVAAGGLYSVLYDMPPRSG